VCCREEHRPCNNEKALPFRCQRSSYIILIGDLMQTKMERGGRGAARNVLHERGSGERCFFSVSSGFENGHKNLIFFVSENRFTCSSNNDNELKHQEYNEDYLEV